MQATKDVLDLMLAQEAEINRLREAITALANDMGAGHLECRDKLLAIVNR